MLGFGNAVRRAACYRSRIIQPKLGRNQTGRAGAVLVGAFTGFLSAFLDQDR